MRTLIRRRLAAAGSVVLTAGALLGSLCLVVTLVAPLVGIRPLIFLSGSMSPTIPAGSLALARTVDASAIEVNDIVTVPSNGTYLTHRVVEVTHAPGRATLLLRGDGNKDVDATVYEVGSTPRTEIWVPHVGRVVAWLSHAPGVYVLAGWVAIVLGSLRRRGGGSGRCSPPEGRAGRPKLLLVAERTLGRGWRGSRGPVRRGRLTGTAAFVTLVLAVPTPAEAAWADTAPVSGTTLGTVTPSAPVASCGTASGGLVTMHWTARTAATGYRLSYGPLNSQTLEVVGPDVTSKTIEGKADGRFSVQTMYGDTWVSAWSNVLKYDTSGGGGCTNA